VSKILILCAVAALARAEDPRVIVTRATQNLIKADHIRDEYTYAQREVIRELDADGKVKSTRTTVKEVMWFAGKRVERVIEKDSKPLSASDAKREQAKIDKAALAAGKMTQEERKAALAKRDREIEKDNDWLRNIADAFDFSMRPEQIVNGRATYVIDAEPKPAYHGKNSAMLNKVKGTLYVDRDLSTLVHLDGTFLESFSMGLFLFKVDKGTRFSFDRVRVNDEVWMPQRFAFNAEARALIKRILLSGEFTFSDYKKFRTDSRIVSTAVSQ
jgi:hypothetical protein